MSDENLRDSEEDESDDSDSTSSGKQNGSSFTILLSGLIPGGLLAFFVSVWIKSGVITNDCST